MTSGRSIEEIKIFSQILEETIKQDIPGENELSNRRNRLGDASSVS